MHGLLQYAETPSQVNVINALIKTGGNQSQAAKHLGVDLRGMLRTFKRVEQKAINQGYAPEYGMTHTCPDGFHVLGTSTYHKEDRQWVKTQRDSKQKTEDYKEFIDGLCEGIKGKSKPVALLNKKHNPDLMSLVIFGDAHIGMKAWKEETGYQDFDSDIACEGIRDAIDNMVARSPDAETGVLIDVGDFIHMNGSSNTTFKGTPVDASAPYAVVLKAAGKVMQYCITRMLKKYKYVKVVVARGNHNEDPAIAVAAMLEFFYDNNDRVEIAETIGHHHYIEFGKWLIGVNHGDKIKPQELVTMMARDHKAWSDSRFRVWITGHIHHQRVIEIGGCVVASFNSLAPKDGWHTSMGYGGRQAATLMTIHKTKGKHSTIEYDLPE